MLKKMRIYISLFLMMIVINTHLFGGFVLSWQRFAFNNFGREYSEVTAMFKGVASELLALYKVRPIIHEILEYRKKLLLQGFNDEEQKRIMQELQMLMDGDADYQRILERDKVINVKVEQLHTVFINFEEKSVTDHQLKQKRNEIFNGLNESEQAVLIHNFQDSMLLPFKGDECGTMLVHTASQIEDLLTRMGVKEDILIKAGIKHPKR